jgi:hypothetical protein
MIRSCGFSWWRMFQHLSSSLLGRVYSCFPSFFGEHMCTIGYRREKKIDENGEPSAANASTSSFLQSPKLSPTEVGDSPYFSLCFLRLFEYYNDDERKLHKQRRTMFRFYNEDDNVLEERVTGVMDSNELRAARVGRYSPYFFQILWLLICNRHFSVRLNFARSSMLPKFGRQPSAIC